MSGDIKSEREIRKNWSVNDKVEVYSKSRGEWFPAKIIEIYTDEDGEWLAVVVAETMVKEVQRFNTDVRPLRSNDSSSDSDSEISDSDSTLDSSSVDLSGSDSNLDSDDEKLEKAKKNKKRDKKLAKKMQMVVIFVERAGTSICNGKYVYETTKNGYPVFSNLMHENVTIWFDDDDEKWIFSDKSKKLYWSDGENTELPPSKGWTKMKGEFPVPGVRLDRLNNEQGKDNFFEDDPYKFSPFLIMKLTFNVQKKVGFDVELIKAHNEFVAIKSIEDDSQAKEMGLLPGDILVNVNGEDLSGIKDVVEVMETIEEHVSITKSKTKGSDEIPKINITFAREKSVFKVMMVQRAGTDHVNGKYTISGTENGALKFVRNDDRSYSICRIYVSPEDEPEDESIWALRKDGKDFYIILAGARDDVPPECGWEAVDPHGIWPSPGITYYDVNIVPPPKPVIRRIQPNPNAVQLHFTCDGERRPKVCPHMDIWYEVECKHILNNKDDESNSKKTNTKKHIRFAPELNDNKTKGESVIDDLTNDHKDHREKHTKVIRVNDSPVVFDKLVNGEEYIFSVRSCNQVSSSTSEPTDKVVPLRLPPKPRIRDIKGYPGELFVTFTCPRAQDKDVQGKFEVIVDPPIPEKSQIHKMRDGRLMVEDDSLPIRLRGLKNGTTYQIIIACVNSVGVTYSEPESAWPSKAPPQPQIKQVIAGNREITIHFECSGYDAPDVRAWFEVDIDPPPPELLSLTSSKTLVKNKSDQTEFTYTDDEKSFSARSPTTPSRRHKSRPRLGRKKSRWAKFNSYDDEEDDFVPLFRRATRYMSSPVKLSPLNNGQDYCVRIKCVTLTATKITTFSDPVVPKGPPPMPKVTKVRAKESSAELHFECDDYATEEYKAKFHIESKPTTLSLKGIIGSPTIFKGLRNGVNYKFIVRGINKEGKSKWSDPSPPVTPLMRPPEPVSIKTIGYDKEISVFWVCEELNQPQYQGWYEISSDPPSYVMVVSRQQATFRRLQNGKSYKFKVAAVNEVDRCESEWSKECSTDSKKAKKTYLRERKRAAVLCREEVLENRKKRKREKTQNYVENLRKKRLAAKDLESKQQRNAVAKKLAKKKRKEKNRINKNKRKEEERLARKLKMEQQRKKVLTNKRRMSLLHRERINNLQQQWNRRQNTNTASSMMNRSKKSKLKNKSSNNKKRSRKSNGFGSTRKSVNGKSSRSRRKSNNKVTQEEVID